MSPREAGGLHEGDVLTRRYRLLERIASGGMSAIWRAFDQSLHRMVAVKVLDGPLGGDHGERELMRREARATARLIHPDAIEVYDYGETVTSGGRMAAFVVMRLLDGTPLADRITEGPLPWREAVTIAARVATVLAAAHERGIVHRDVTAENVLITPDGSKLLDFGIAAFVGEQVDERVAEYGTPPYVAPERLAGAITDPAVDVYSLGVLLFEMLVGRTPYPETTWAEVEAACREGPPPVPAAPGLPGEVGALCRRCLDADPAARPSAQHVADVLIGTLTAPPAAVPQPGGGGMSRGTAVTLSVLATLAASFGVVAWTGAGDLPPPPAVTMNTHLTPVQPSRTSPPASPPAAEAADPRRRGGAAGGPSVTSGESPAREPTGGPQSPARETTGDGESPAREVAGGGESPARDVARVGATSLPDAVAAFTAAVRVAEEDRLIPAHVALDLRQVAQNLLGEPADLAGALAGLRLKVQDRSREGLLPGAVRQALEVRLTVIGTALTRHTRQA
ncbi:hypothetical protein Misp01_55390 [Microtetraspora sp. NBRC 13810]|uniref:serine/threonine-protein kinase n=1 Tax=Microtetraspora sp. NBRC 13810 TaxID=3030990 RepID=UPI0024A22B3D|nr:serine/threonine-protein kinase [Microtetraspora sp. NBRC 13810]GLW10411.1 hypothetical protein Misp01_55390 [Microtetraspora sp. NBRC 13810]